MNRSLAALISTILTIASASAAPLYAGMQLGDDSASALFGYQINNTYAVEAHYSRSDPSISHAGVTVDSSIVGAGLVGIAKFHMMLKEVLPYILFVKAGYQRTTTKETYSIPSSVTLTLPYYDTINSYQNQFIFGGGAEYDFTKKVVGRMGVDFVGNDRSIYFGAIFKF